MDFLDRLQAREERLRNLHTVEAPAKPQPNPSAHTITVIGCIKGVDGWYRAGYDENTKTIIPMEMIEKTR